MSSDSGGDPILALAGYLALGSVCAAIVVQSWVPIGVAAFSIGVLAKVFGNDGRL